MLGSRGTELADEQALPGRERSNAMPGSSPGNAIPSLPMGTAAAWPTEVYTLKKKAFFFRSFPEMELFLHRESCWHSQQSPWHVVLSAHTHIGV